MNILDMTSGDVNDLPADTLCVYERTGVGDTQEKNFECFCLRHYGMVTRAERELAITFYEAAILKIETGSGA